jgi:hypothetical protein
MNSRIRGWRRAAWLAVTCVVGVGGVAAETNQAVQDPYFGDVLYFDFQDRNFPALTDLMLAQHFGRVSHHADESEIVRGRLLLSYGAQREAGKVFASLLEGKAKPSIRDRAWYYLAKIHYQRGQIAEAEEAINRIGSDLPKDLEEDRQLLRAQLRVAQDDYNSALDIFERMSRSGSASALYAKHNLGVALVKTGDSKRGVALLDEVGTAAVDGDELLSLRDKANVALGYAALQDHDPAAARKYLERVRLTGLYANKALLGFGWALLSTDQVKEALVPWNELAHRPGAVPAILEAKLALPYALGQLGAHAESLDRYNEAVSAFLHESANLDESIAAIRHGDLLDDLLLLNPGEETGWFWTIDRLPHQPHAEHLAQVMAEREFQETFKYFSDLRFLSDNLKQWESSVDAFRGMLENRRQAFASQLPRLRSSDRAAALSRLSARRDGVAADLGRVEAESDAAALADAHERKLRSLLDNAREILSRGGGGAELDGLRERTRRLSGALLWQQTQRIAERQMEAQSELGEIGTGLGAAAARSAALDKVQDGAEARFDAFDQRIDLQSRRIRALQQRVDAQMLRQKDYAQELAVAALEQQKERLATYLTQARFAVAQIYDQAKRAKEAPKPEGAADGVSKKTDHAPAH